MNPSVVIRTTQDLIYQFEDIGNSGNSELHQEARRIAEDLRLYKEECESDVVSESYLSQRKAELSDRMDAWDLSVALLQYGPFPPDPVSEYLQ